MQITFSPFNNTNSYKYNPAFQAMKKTQFNGIDRFIVERYKAPIEKYNVLDDLYEFCKKKVADIIKKDYGGRWMRTQELRKIMLKEWSNYVTVENGAYTLPIQLMILAGITGILKQNDDTLPPVLNKGILANTVTKIEDELKINPNAQINFEKEYRNNLQKNILAEETVLDKSLNGWIIIPSKKRDPENYEKNVDKLKTLSHSNWCTKGYNANVCLTEGDFHIYMNQGNPLLGIRFNEDIIEEIQDENNCCKIPARYYNIVKEHIKDLKLSKTACKEIEKLEKVKIEVDKIKSEFPNGVENATTEEILKYFKVPFKKDPTDGLLILESFDALKNGYNYCDLGINENEMFKDIKAIEGNANFGYSELTSLGKLKSIGGNANFWNSKITDLNELEYVGGNASFWRSKITNLKKLKHIGGKADFWNTKITSLFNLESINGNPVSQKLKAPNAFLNYCLIDATIPEIFDALHIKYKKDENGLYTISHYTDFYKIPYSKFGIDQDKLFKVIKAIEGDICLIGSPVTDLGNLESIGGNGNFCNSKIESLGKVKSIGGNVNLLNSQVKSLGNLESISGDFGYINNYITTLDNLKYIGGDALLNGTKVTDLGKLEYIGGNAWFPSTEILTLKNLKYIGKQAYFRNSNVVDLGKLKTIGGNATFVDSKITDFGELECVNGDFYFPDCPNQEGLKKIKIGGRKNFDWELENYRKK